LISKSASVLANHSSSLALVFCIGFQASSVMPLRHPSKDRRATERLVAARVSLQNGSQHFYKNT
jgi:hypothetical protein